MHFIVFDLEWNQSPRGKKDSDQQLPFEIIEIGAVKLNEKKEIVDRFHRLIKPQVYNWINDNIHDLIHVDYKDLMHGEPFAEAAQDFIRWCGKDDPEWSFFTWGNQDVMELQRNMKYYYLLDLLPGPIYYYDVQKLFGIRFEDRKSRRSLEYAIDFLKLEKTMDFHRALEDAWYTAEVLMHIENSCIFPNSSLDVYQNPKSKKEEIHVSYETYDKFVSREFPSREKLMKDREVISTKCPVCHNPAKKKIRWFCHGTRNFYSLSVCQQHGYIKGKIRIRKTEEEQYFTVKTVKPITEEEAEGIREKREALRRKRQMKHR
ncbi:MAG: exonuclease domain-containing protein [Blautia sp.]|nr:exonuclease domain-containing protein [Blautia sp.]